MVDFLKLQDQLLSDFFFPTLSNRSKMDSYPKTNAYVRYENVTPHAIIKDMVIEMSIPYLSKENVTLDINEYSRTIYVEGNPVKNPIPDANFALREIPLGSFRRTFTVSGPFDLDPAGIVAKLDNGILRIVVPAKDRVTKTRRIALK